MSSSSALDSAGGARAELPLARAAELAAAAPAEASPRRYRVYTRTGDGGTSSLYNGVRRSKDDMTFSALGDVDELNAALGMAREFLLQGGGACARLAEQLTEIQSRLLDAGSAIATPISGSSPAQLARVAFDPAQAAQLEAWIDEMDDQLPPLKNFILPVRRARG